MSRFEGPQGIVTNGLVLNLDAGDPDSYTRSQPPFVEVLVVAGGGGGGQDGAGGGGAGGLIYNSAYQLTSAAAVTVTIGGGGVGSAVVGGQASDGSNSVFGALTAIGGGGGGSKLANGRSGGSGGGSGHNAAGPNSQLGGSGTAGQGFNGGNNNQFAGGGGGGAAQSGANPSSTTPGNGGNGQLFAISGTSTYYAGGGGGGGYASPVTSSGGLGGGGNGGGQLSAGAPSAVGQNGTANTGGGGGSNGNAGNSTVTGTGGSGIVIVRYPGLPAATGGTITYLNGYTIHTFTSSGTFTPYLWNDVSGNGNNGTLVNGVGFNSFQNGGFLTFDGVDDSVVGNKPVLTAVTLEYWCQLTGNSTGGYPHLVMSGNTFIGFVGNTSSARFRIAINPGAGYSEITSDLLNPSATFKLYSMTYDGTTVKMFVNGVQQASTMNIASTFELMTGNAYQLSAVTTPSYDKAPNNMAAFRIYNRALSQAEITQNFNAQRARFGI